MKTEQELTKALNEIEADERLQYPLATVFENAPLALIQIGLKAKAQAYRFALDLPNGKYHKGVKDE